MSAPLLEVSGLSKSYSDGTLEVLQDVNLELERGESLAVVGPSGSGKSTLLNIIGTLEPKSAGSVRFEGRDISALQGRELAQFRNRSLGFVFQHHYLLPQLTALENVLLPTLAESGSDAASHLDRARQLLERVGLGERSGHRPAELSGGERQRVAVVRALILQPKLLLADEPTGSLDARNAEDLGELLVDQCRSEGSALLLVTHSSALAERMGGVCELGDKRLHTPADSASS